MDSLVQVFKPTPCDAATAAVDSVLKGGWLGYGPKCKELEGMFMGRRAGWALATTSCTSALYLAALACRKSEKDEVVLPAITFASTSAAFASAGYRVRLADVDPETLMIDPTSVRSKVNGGTRAIVAVHLYGQRAPVEQLLEICKEHSITLIEDCAHRIDVEADPPVGDLCCYSFNAVKEVTCGEGGLIWGKDPQWEAYVRAASNVGLDLDTRQRTSEAAHQDVSFILERGLKLRLNDILASIAVVSMRTRGERLARRKQIFEAYDRAFEPLRRVGTLQRGTSDSLLMYIIQLDEAVRNGFREYLASLGVASSIHYQALSLAPFMVGEECPIAEQLSRRIVTLPCHDGMNARELERVIEAVVAYEHS